jgi:hypothetical protein
MVKARMFVRRRRGSWRASKRGGSWREGSVLAMLIGNGDEAVSFSRDGAIRTVLVLHSKGRTAP